MMDRQIVLNSIADFAQMMDEEGPGITGILVDAILENLENDLEQVHAADILIEEAGTVIELMLERTEFEEVLRNALPVFEKREMYERCSEIKKALEAFG